ncbi:MAG: hypothetical protein ACJAYU_003913 [Bradymonadia bacterium]
MAGPRPALAGAAGFARYSGERSAGAAKVWVAQVSFTAVRVSARAVCPAFVTRGDQAVGRFARGELVARFTGHTALGAVPWIGAEVEVLVGRQFTIVVPPVTELQATLERAWVAVSAVLDEARVTGAVPVLIDVETRRTDANSRHADLEVCATHMLDAALRSLRAEAILACRCAERTVCLLETCRV